MIITTYLNIFAVETTMTACTIFTTHSNYPLNREPEFKLTAIFVSNIQWV